MAISLRSRESVQKSDTVSQILDKIITKGTDAAKERDRTWLQKATHRSEFEQYMEREQWAKMRSEREKDLVLMFGEDDVKIFKRHPERDVQSRLRSQATREQLTKHDAVDTSGLIPVRLDRGVVKALTSEYVPFSREEREKLEQRRAEILARRQQALLATTYQSGTVALQNAQNQAHQLALAQGQTLAQLADLGITLPKSDTRLGAEPTQIPSRAWQAWMKPQSAAARGATPGGGLPIGASSRAHTPADDSAQTSPAKAFRRHRRRHHRINCKYHPFSTNPEMKRLIVQSTFPIQEVRKSSARVMLALNGASNGYRENATPLQDYFPPVVMCPPRRGSVVNKTSLRTSHNDSPKSLRSGGKSVAFAGDVVSSTPATPFDGSLNVSDVAQPHEIKDDDESAESSSTPTRDEGNGSIAPSNGPDTFVLTQSVLDGSTMSVHTVDLAPFDRPPRPHSVTGTFIDCDCTPRSTDDENPCFGLLGHRASSGTRSGTASEEGSGGEGSEGDATLKQQDPEKKKKKKKKSAPSLMGSAARAEQRLRLWHKDFGMTCVHAQSCLRSILDEREELRKFVLNDRQHLDLVTTEAEISAEEFRVSRHHRCTTPNRGSMWVPVFSTIGEGSKQVAGLVQAYNELLAECKEVQFPCTGWEMQMLNTIRSLCVDAAETSVSPARSRSNTPPGSRARTPTIHQSRLSSASTVGNLGVGRKSAAGISLPSSAGTSLGGGGTTGSLFVKASAGNASPSTATGKPTGAATSAGMTQQEMYAALAFNSNSFFSLLNQFGEKLFRSSEGTFVVETLRKKCFVPSKPFAAFMFSKESSWSFCQDAKQLLKKHSQAGAPLAKS